jgi:hypothetical protein
MSRRRETIRRPINCEPPMTSQAPSSTSIPNNSQPCERASSLSSVRHASQAAARAAARTAASCPGPAPLIGPTFLTFSWLSLGGASTVLLGPGARGRLSVPLARIDFQVRTVVDHMMPLRDLGCRACHLPAPTLAGPGTLESRPCVEVLLASTRRVGPRSPGRRLGGSPPLSGTRLGCSPGHTTGMHAPRRAPGTSLPLAVGAKF